MKTKGRLIILSGPSCVGKGPLCQALETFYPDLYYNMQRLVLYNSRDKRPGEREGVDYYFRSREQMESMRKGENFILLNVRGDLQGLDLQELLQLLDKGKDVLFEGNPFIPQALWNNPALSSIIMQKSFFVSYFSRGNLMAQSPEGGSRSHGGGCHAPQIITSNPTPKRHFKYERTGKH
jgi:guanylate kinase